MEKILFENKILEAIVGDAGNALGSQEPTGDWTANPDGSNWEAGNAKGTDTSDISRHERRAIFSKSLASKSLPALIGYVQPIDSPAAYVFGLKDRAGNSVNQALPVVDPNNPAPVYTPEGIPTTVEVADRDLTIERKEIITGLREIKMNVTNEVEQDINSLFAGDFADSYADFMLYGPSDDNELSTFFIAYATWKMTQKTDLEFMQWLEGRSTNIGTLTIPTYDDMNMLFGAISELTERLFLNNDRAGSTWLIVPPRVASFLSATIGACQDKELLKAVRDIKLDPISGQSADPIQATAVLKMGNIEVYQSADMTADAMYAGIIGGPNESSIFYSPYTEYFVQGGSDYKTGQSNVFFRLRDTWTTNPLEQELISTENPRPSTTGITNSSYVVSCSLDLSATSVFV